MQPADQNTRENLPPTQQAALVPMSAEDYARQGRKKIVLWTLGIGVPLLLLGLAIGMTSSKGSKHNDFDEALKLYNVARYREAVISCSRAIDAKVSVVEARQLRGNLYKILNNPQNAVTDLSWVIERRPDSADNYRARAECYRQLAQYESALKDLDKLLTLQPSASVYNSKGICLRDMGQTARSLEAFSKAVDLEPNVDNLIERGMALAAMGENQKAIADFDRVIELRPEMPYTYRSRASARDALGDHDGASVDRNKARSIEYPGAVLPSRPKQSAAAAARQQ